MGKSLSEIKAELKRRGLQGDARRSLAMGEADPRNRSAARAGIATGLRYVQDQLQVDKDGRLGIADEAIRTETIHRETIKEIRVGGEIVIPAETRVQNCQWRRKTDETGQTADFRDVGETLNADVMGIVPSISNTTTEYALWHCPIPPDGDTAVDWSIHILTVSLGGNGGTYTWDVEVFALNTGDDLEGSGGIVSPDATTQIAYTTPHPVADGYVTKDSSGVFDTVTVLADTPGTMFFRLTLVSGPTNAADTAIPAMWLEYLTPAQTIAVTES